MDLVAGGGQSSAHIQYVQIVENIVKRFFRGMGALKQRWHKIDDYRYNGKTCEETNYVTMVPIMTMVLRYTGRFCVYNGGEKDNYSNEVRMSRLYKSDVLAFV